MDGNDDLAGFCAPVDLLNQLCGGLTAGLGVARIDGDDLRVQELHQRGTTYAGDLQLVDALFL